MTKTIPFQTLAAWGRLITSHEVKLLQCLTGLRHIRFLTAFFLLASRLGDGPLWIATGLAFMLLGNAGERWAVTTATLAIGASVAVFMILKNVIGRPRPFETWKDLGCLMAPPDRFSFPSGHTMTSFAAATVYALLIPQAGVFFLPIAAIIGGSRVFLGCHYPTDVLAGGILGSGIGFVATVFVRHFLLP
jgi:undecaprenyl-diphosphatase